MDKEKMPDFENLIYGDLAAPGVLKSSSRLYIAYRPDSDVMYNRHPELRSLSDNWVRDNRRNNAGDLPRVYMFSLNIKQVMADGVAGDFAELGVFRGNSSAILAHYAREHGRTLYLFDTFAGFATADMTGVDAGKPMQFSDTSEGRVLDNTGSESVICIKGRFPESVTADDAEQRYAVVHLDCDLYEPTKAGLEFFYPRLNPGAMLIMHDYVNEYWDGVKRAVDEFRGNIPEQLVIMPDKSGTAILRKMR